MRPAALYNEIEPFPAEWLARLSAAGEIAPGDVSTKSIVDLRPADVEGYAQFHAFAGIGVWSRALRDAGVPDDFPVWTGSCPCQPFSNAGSRKGFDDERHLWPAWFSLIRECRPPVVLGEQVANGDGLQWLDLVYADLEGAGYTVGAADLCAASVGAPHRRQRLFFVGVAGRDGQQGFEPDRATPWAAVRSGAAYVLADDDDEGQREQQLAQASHVDTSPRADSDTRRATRGFWADVDWLACSDGKARVVEPGTFPLVDGATYGVERSRAKEVRGYGNAIVLPLAVEFIRCALGL